MKVGVLVCVEKRMLVEKSGVGVAWWRGCGSGVVKQVALVVMWWGGSNVSVGRGSVGLLCEATGVEEEQGSSLGVRIFFHRPIW